MEDFKVGGLVAYATKDSFGYQYIVAKVTKVNKDSCGLRTQPDNVFVCIPKHALTRIKTVWQDTMKLVEGEN